MKCNSKILLVNTRHYLGGGDSTYTFMLADLLRKNGHEVNFIAMKDPRNFPDSNEDLFISNIDFRSLNENKNPINGLKVLTRVIYSSEAREKFTKLLVRVMPDIVHLQNIHAHITPSIIFEAKKFGIPVVWTLHDYKLVCPNSHFLIDTTGQICEACRGGNFIHAIKNRCKKGSLLASSMASLEAYAHRWMNILDNVDAFLCPSEFLAEKLLENGFLPEKVHHVPLFLTESQFSQQNLKEGYFLFLGKLEPLKGIFPLLEAAKRVPEVKIILAGRVEEPIKSQLPGLLPPNVEYVGMKSGEDLEALRRNAIALVLPSICYENQPLSILEMFGTGKPVIASNIGGMRELIGEGERGLLVEPGSVSGLSDALHWIAAHPSEAARMGTQAQKYVMMYHSSEYHYDRVTSIYDRVQGKNGCVS